MQLKIFKVKDGNTVKIVGLDQDYRANPGNSNSVKAENRYIPFKLLGLTAMCSCVQCRMIRA